MVSIDGDTSWYYSSKNEGILYLRTTSNINKLFKQMTWYVIPTRDIRDQVIIK